MRTLIMLAVLPLALWAAPAPSAYTFVAASFLGGTGDTDAVVGCAIQVDGTIVLAANLAADFGAGLKIDRQFGKAEDLGAVLRISADGRKVLTLHRVAPALLDMALDKDDAIYLAAGPTGALKLTAQADAVAWTYATAGACARIDAGADGHAAVLVDGKALLLGTDGTLLATAASARRFSDVCLDGASKTLIALGTRNANAFDGKQLYPVQISYLKGFGYDGAETWSDYDWDTDTKSERFINRSENNMADSRGYRCAIGRDGKLYAAFEVAGGNHIFRYLPTDIMKKSTVVRAESGGQFHTLYAGGAAHRTVFGRFDPATGTLDRLQQFSSRSPAGRGGNVRMKSGDLAVDEDGRPFLAGWANPDLPIDPNPCAKEEPLGGPFLLGMSADFARRLVCTRLQGTAGFAHCVDVRRIGEGIMVVYAGSEAAEGLFTKDALQPTHTGRDAFFAILRGPVDALPEK
jgi:hypothetical protein